VPPAVQVGEAVEVRVDDAEEASEVDEIAGRPRNRLACQRRREPFEVGDHRAAKTRAHALKAALEAPAPGRPSFGPRLGRRSKMVQDGTRGV
jgi:hypothetical protein